MIITMRHLRAMGWCSRGVREVAKKGQLDWNSFLENGVELEQLKGKIDPGFYEELEMRFVRR